jgi:hypothetical protein
MSHIVICGLSGCKVVCHIISKTELISGGGGGGVNEHKMCVLFLYKIFVLNIYHYNKTDRDMIKTVYRSACKVP